VVSLRSVYYIAIDSLSLTFILFKKLAPKFIFINACIPEVYKETEKYFALIDNCLMRPGREKAQYCHPDIFPGGMDSFITGISAG
jgi:hypothetical protein